jgi:hypothetical protein
LLVVEVVEAAAETRRGLAALVEGAVVTVVAVLQTLAEVAQELMRFKTLQAAVRGVPVLLLFATLAHSAALVER